MTQIIETVAESKLAVEDLEPLAQELVWPQPKVDLQTTVDIVNYYQRRQASASRSHRKRRLAKRIQLE